MQDAVFILVRERLPWLEMATNSYILSENVSTDALPGGPRSWDHKTVRFWLKQIQKQTSVIICGKPLQYPRPKYAKAPVRSENLSSPKYWGLMKSGWGIIPKSVHLHVVSCNFHAFIEWILIQQEMGMHKRKLGSSVWRENWISLIPSGFGHFKA